MSYILSLIVLAGASTSPCNQGAHFNNYTDAHKLAKQTGRPMLVILNPGVLNGTKTICLADVRKTRERRALLKDYIIVLIDTESKHGKYVNELFNTPSLPHVAVIDKKQKYQIFTTSDQLYGQLWTEILETYREGVPVDDATTARLCST